MRYAWLLLFAIGCGTSGGGEPLMGDVAIQYGSSMPDLTTGSAIQSKSDPTKMVVQLGTDHVDCKTDLDSSFFAEGGTYVFFLEDSATPGTDAQAVVNVENVTGNNINVLSATGSVTISTIDTRVTGTVMLTASDMSIGMVTVNGNFDVKRCF